MLRIMKNMSADEFYQSLDNGSDILKDLGIENYEEDQVVPLKHFVLDVSKTTDQFKESTPIVILRMDGEDLLDFINNPRFESEMIYIFNQLILDHNGDPNYSLLDYITMALCQLTVDHGVPPASDSWVMSNIIEPALELICRKDNDKEIITGERLMFLFEQFKTFLHKLVQNLRDNPVIVAHIRSTLDGSEIKKLLLLSHKQFDYLLDKVFDTVNKKSVMSGKSDELKEYIRRVLDMLAPAIGLPPYGVTSQMDKVIDGVLVKMADEEEVIIEEENYKELKRLMRKILRSIMLELNSNPISISFNSVILGPPFST